MRGGVELHAGNGVAGRGQWIVAQQRVRPCHAQRSGCFSELACIRVPEDLGTSVDGDTVDLAWIRGDVRTMKPAKAMTIRLSAEQADELATVATVDNQPVSEIIRAAIAEHIEKRKRDEQFQDSLKDRITRAQQMLGDR